MELKIYSAAMTVLKEDKTFDSGSMARMLTRNIDHGIGGFFILGTMGEGMILPESTREDVIKGSCDIIGNKAEIIANISDFGLERTYENIETFSKYDVDSYALQLPVKSLLTVDDPMDYLIKVADKADKPLYLYYIPVINNCRFTIAQFKELLSHPNIIGLKNSSGCMYTRKELLVLKDEIDFLLFEGHEWAIDEALIEGCDGALCGFTSLSSKLMVNLGKAVSAGNIDEAKNLQKVLVKIFNGVYGSDLTTVWSGQKYALYKLGIIDNYTSIVHQQDGKLTDDVKARIETTLDQYRNYLED